jgi:hypothetical protein
VPKYRSFLEYFNFLILFVLYVTAMEGIEGDRLNAKELAFIIYALCEAPCVRSHRCDVDSSAFWTSSPLFENMVSRVRMDYKLIRG